MNRAEFLLSSVFLLFVLGVALTPLREARAQACAVCQGPTGSSTFSCSSTTSGMVQWTGTGFEVCNGTSWTTVQNGGLILISTQTASSSASLQWTNLPTYNTLFLNCAGLIGSTTTTLMKLEVGESTGPTWETGAHYTSTFNYWWNNGSGSGSGTSTATDLLNITSGTLTTTVPISIKAYIDNITSSSVYKNVSWTWYSNLVGQGFTEAEGAGYWNNDTNTITALEILPTSGTITSGTCSLYGIN